MRPGTLYVPRKTPYTAHKVGDLTVFAALSTPYAGNPAPNLGPLFLAFRKRP